MAFNRGIFDASPSEVATCGLLSVARVVTWDAADEDWLRGYNYEVLPVPLVEIVNKDNLAVTGGEVTPADNTRFYPGEGFIISAEVSSSGMGLNGKSLQENAVESLRGVTQKAIEQEFWTGVSILASSSDAPFLSDAGGATDTTGGGKPAAIALRYLEQAIATSPLGTRGIIHMTRDVASELGSRLLYKGKGDSATSDRAITRLGTRVVIGSGYTGKGPEGATGDDPTATNKWMYVTGEVDVQLGQIEIVSGIGDAFNTSHNDALVVIQRAAAVHFDPTLWAAAQVTLPTS